MIKIFSYLEAGIKKFFLAAQGTAKIILNAVLKIPTLLKPLKTLGLVILTVYISVTISAYYRPIQEVIHKGIGWVYSKDDAWGDFVYDLNGILLNGKDFDRERSGKKVIYTAYSQVVMVNVIPKDFENAQARNQSGRGTGWFYKIDGDDAYIVTNHHVIDSAITNAETVELKVATGMDMWDYDAEIVGVDEIADIAVIKITKKDNEEWETLEFEEYDEIGVGDSVAILGHGMGMTFTATQGTITYKDRYGSRPYNLMLQVDAVINQGNSGGPIMNMEGRVVAVAQSIISPARQIPGWDGIGLGVGSKNAKRSIDYILSPQYKAKEYVPYAELPFSMGTVELEEVADIPKDERYHLKITYKDMPEDREPTIGEIEGFLEGDIIMEVNGDEIRSSFSIIKKVVYAFPGDEWTVKIRRGDEIITKKLALREMDRNKLLGSVNRGGR